MSPSPTLDRVLADPAYLPHRFDPASERLLYIETDPAILDRTAFLDGRTPFASGPGEMVVDLADALAWGAERPASPAPPMIFHTAFCGSTLLARACSVPGRTLALKEPHVLVDLANWRAGLGEEAAGRYRAALAFVLGQLGRPHGGAVLVKPSNWINNIAADIVAAGGAPALFMSSSLRAFLVAVFRGGRDRITFVCRFVIHMERALPGFSPLIRAATSGGDPLVQAARLCALAMAMQQRAFAAARRAGDTDLDYAELAADPIAAVRRAAAALGLGLDEAEIAASVARTFRTHAKAPGTTFDRSEAAGADAAVIGQYGAIIDQAERWLGAQAMPD